MLRLLGLIVALLLAVGFALFAFGSARTNTRTSTTEVDLNVHKVVVRTTGRVKVFRVPVEQQGSVVVTRVDHWSYPRPKGSVRRTRDGVLLVTGTCPGRIHLACRTDYSIAVSKGMLVDRG
jgi:hypothetical protein